MTSFLNDLGSKASGKLHSFLLLSPQVLTLLFLPSVTSLLLWSQHHHSNTDSSSSPSLNVVGFCLVLTSNFPPHKCTLSDQSVQHFSPSFTLLEIFDDLFLLSTSQNNLGRNSKRFFLFVNFWFSLNTNVSSLRFLCLSVRCVCGAWEEPKVLHLY